MNVWGKVLAFLVVLTSLFCTYFTAKLIHVRNNWASKAQPFETGYASAKEKLTESRRQHEQLRNELNRLNREWGAFYNGVNTQITAPDGRLAVDLGTNHRLREKQELHGFEMQADGSVIFRGTFTVITAQPDRSAVAPTWRARPEEVQSWRTGQWRWRTLVPSAHTELSDEQNQAISRADETLGDRQSQLRAQERLIAEAQQQRQHRIAELMGGPQLAQDEALSPEFKQGLAVTLASVEEERNKVLVEIDDLRRKVRQARDAVLRLQQENEQLVLKLPQPASAVSRRD